MPDSPDYLNPNIINQNFIQIVYFISAFLFILGLKKMSSPVTAKNGLVLAGIGIYLWHVRRRDDAVPDAYTADWHQVLETRHRRSTVLVFWNTASIQGIHSMAKRTNSMKQI